MNPQANSQYIPILELDEDIGDAPEVLRGFYNTCALAGPSKCPLSRNYPTPESMEGAVTQVLNGVQKNWNDTLQPSYNKLVLKYIFSALYAPSSWPLLAEGIVLGLSQLANGTNVKLLLPEEKRYPPPYVRSASMGLPWRLDARQQVDEFANGYYWDGNYTLVVIA
jgi:hypothetical protein